jgi:hypothetical protein
MVKLCRVTAIDASELSRIMRTIEVRLGESSGMNWRHGQKALLLLKALVLHGPEVTWVVVSTLASFYNYVSNL